ncbi:serine/threonine-protein kinase chk-1-like [Oratosquilla oratoria]|uniref:serine/threonine-protein kinase chk-1-like n=1 Tax=Oratosquilla oratoria TaxID=337810 RepID=UPI003F75AC8A
MEFEKTSAEEERGAGVQKTWRDMSFEKRVRAFVRSCSKEEQEKLLKHYKREVGLFLEAAKEDLLETDEHILRIVKIVNIVLEEIGRRLANKRRLVDSDESPSGKKRVKHFSVDHKNTEVIKLLGRGGFGSVFLVQDVTSGQECAIKCVRIQHLKRQLEEISIHRRLDHKNIVAFLGEERDRKFVYIYLEFVEGGTLEDKIQCGGMREGKAQFLFTQLISGMKYLHSRRVAHRDLKPENLLLSKSEKEVKIGDFGLAVVLEKKRLLWGACGTPGYMAPEVFNRRYKGECADVWSSGIILLRVLTGEIPWEDAVSRDLSFKLWTCSTSEMRLRRPWRSLSKSAFSLVRQILTPRPENRATVSDIERNNWFRG